MQKSHGLSGNWVIDGINRHWSATRWHGPDLRYEFKVRRWCPPVLGYRALAITAFHDQTPHAIRVDQAFIRRCYLGQAAAYEALGDTKSMQDCLDLAAR